MTERTLAIIKPDAVAKHAIGDIIQRYEGAGLYPIAMKMVRLSKQDAEGFYAVHRERPFFNDLTTYMASGPAVVLVLEGENAIAKNRDLMGATDPKKANAVHGSDATETAKFEIGYLFPELK